jgi:hypothetical protein
MGTDTLYSLAVENCFDGFVAARKFGFNWDETVITAAAEIGNLRIVTWARENGCPWDANTVNAAARSGNHDLLQWIFANKCEYDFRLAHSLGLGGNIELVTWVLEQGYPMNRMTYLSMGAARVGVRFEVLLSCLCFPVFI